MVKPGVQILFKEKVLESVLLEKQETRIGRLGDNEIVLDNLAVSRYHAKIVEEKGKFYLVDLGSSNGTQLNGALASKDELHVGDEIGIAKFAIRFLLLSTDRMDLAGRKKPRAGGSFEKTLETADPAKVKEMRERLRAGLAAASAPQAPERAPDASARSAPAVGPPRASHSLRVYRGGHVLFEEDLVEDQVRIGRSAESDLILDGTEVSRFHAIVSREDGRLVLEDLGSANGTMVNDKNVSRVELSDGDRIRIGDFEILLRTVSSHGARMAAVAAQAVGPLAGEGGLEASGSGILAAGEALLQAAKVDREPGADTEIDLAGRPDLSIAPVLALPGVGRELLVGEVRVEVRCSGCVAVKSFVPDFAGKLPPESAGDESVRVGIQLGDRFLEKAFALSEMAPALPEPKPREHDE